MSVKVRFAPSPTGNLHIGSARTALYNYLFARHHGGKFVLRIEDTDQARSTKEFEKDILEGLAWLGYTSDEPLVYQAQRIDLHKQYIKQLLDKGLAYQDNESPAIYFKVPTEGETIIPDVVKGDISFQNKDFKDQVILKSDGSVTYNFGVVIDDALMGITHVIRGEDHISNTPKQIFFYQALGFPVPKFGHIPMILGTDRTKLSKRHGATSINEYRKGGYIPESINNYLALLGWTPADGKEVMTMAELIERFDLDRASKSNSIFDIKKLNWLNGQKLRAMTSDELIAKAESLPAQFLDLLQQDKARAVQMLESVRDNLELSTNLGTAIAVYFKKDLDLGADLELLKKHESKTVFALISQKISKELMPSADYPAMYNTVNAIIEAIVKETGFKKGQILHPLRVAISGEHSGPGLKYLIALLGKELVLERIAHAARC